MNSSIYLQVQNFGEPFLLIVKEDETLSSVKERIKKKLQVQEEEFSKVQDLNIFFSDANLV